MKMSTPWPTRPCAKSGTVPNVCSKCFCFYKLFKVNILYQGIHTQRMEIGGRRCRGRMVVRFTTIYVINTYHH